MPYIKNNQRPAFGPMMQEVPLLHEPGLLNYGITMLCDRYFQEHGFRYATINEVIGVLECAKLEMYRRLAGPYKDEKIAENGDMPLYLRRRQ